MGKVINEDTIEQAALSWLSELGYSILFGPDIAFGELFSERNSFGDVVLIERLRAALMEINRHIPPEALNEALKKIIRVANDSPNLETNNHRFHRLLIDGIPVEYRADDGRLVHDNAMLVDFTDHSKNDWLAVNQFTVIEGGKQAPTGEEDNRRPDIVIFVNGLPVAVIELKNPVDEKATIDKAFNQLQTYKKEIPSLLAYNEIMVVSDGLEAKVGTLTSGREWFLPWRTVKGDDLAPSGSPQLEVLIKGIFDKQRLLDLIRNFIVFEIDGDKVNKMAAGYHQFHAVNHAIDCTISATAPAGDKRVGVVWHTQGSGKSLTMAFYAGKLIQEPAMKNPTVVMITDRNDLDGQLFDKFASCQELLRQSPIQAGSRNDLRDLLKRASGGVIFTTIQKFFPESNGDAFPLLSERRNIVVIADEAHRSQYDFIKGFAKHMRNALPNASFIGFTGTPIEKADKSTPAVFGNYISVYDIHQAVEDRATVPIYYEGRLAKIELNEAERPKIDPDFEEVTEAEEASAREKLKSKWARLEAMVGTKKRLALVAKDIVEHFDKRLEILDGKAMIVCMSRRICVDLHDAIAAQRPEWYSSKDQEGIIKVVMTGSAEDGPDWQEHIRNKARRENLRNRFKNPADQFKVVIVRDMWLTGFDAPSLHTMYIDKPMRGHGLMQAIARVNRVFKDKPGGLVVDYLGIAAELKKALAEYTECDRNETGIDQAEAVAVMLEKYEIAAAMFHGFDYSKFITGTETERTETLSWGVDHILTQEDGKVRFTQTVAELSKAFALSVPNEEALAVRDDVAFFQAVKSALSKITAGESRPTDELDTAIKQIVSRAVSSNEVIDIFSAAGLKKPNISILSDEFLDEVKNLPQKNMALETLRKLLNDEIKTYSRRNLVQSRSFSEMLENTIIKYQNRTIEAAQIIAELIELAKDLREAHRRGDDLGLSEDELAFYDALEVNDSAVKVLGDETLKIIAAELVESVRSNISIDWTLKDSTRAKIRTIVKRILRKYGYPPDKQEKATQTVLEQAELLGDFWAA